MKNGKLLDLYSDYLISAFGQTTATGLSALLNGGISHDNVQRYLAGARQTSTDLWRLVKVDVRKVESADGVLIVDDTFLKSPTQMKMILSVGTTTIRNKGQSKASIL